MIHAPCNQWHSMSFQAHFCTREPTELKGQPILEAADLSLINTSFRICEVKSVPFLATELLLGKSLLCAPGLLLTSFLLESLGLCFQAPCTPDSQPLSREGPSRAYLLNQHHSRFSYPHQEVIWARPLQKQICRCFSTS